MSGASIAMAEPKTKPQPFDYLYDTVHTSRGDVVQVYTRDPRSPDLSTGLAAAIWDPALVEAVRALPELVHALDGLLQDVEHYGAAGIPASSTARNVARAALAKATGARLATGDGGGA